MNVCVVAQGKIGLPLAVQIAGKGHSVVGVDIDAKAVATINSGEPPFPGEANLDVRLQQVLADGNFTADTNTAEAVSNAEVVIVVVPLIVDDQANPDFRAMDAATADIARGLKPGTLVSYETTLPVHTTRQRFAPALEAGSGLVEGTDFYVCHSPERVYSGRIFADLRAYPKLVGGLDAKGAELAVKFYEAALDFDLRDDLDRPNGVWDLGSAEAAELAKLMETTYRDVNIGLANQFARFSDKADIDVYAVISACNSQPFSHVHQPGIAVGGHCIPVYPRFYMFNDAEASIPAAARATNDSMPQYSVDQLADLMGDLNGQHVVILGAAYRGDVQETAFSGVFGVVQALEKAGAIVSVHDPLYSDDELRTFGLTPHELGTACDGLILQANHSLYADLSPVQFPGVRGFVDGRNMTSAEPWRAARVPRAVIGAPQQ
ncbi:MAG: nucleotide sugar dehydrogenase [Acidimicrobiales bacterium]